jgi:hypothetical protein
MEKMRWKERFWINPGIISILPQFPKMHVESKAFKAHLKIYG